MKTKAGKIYILRNAYLKDAIVKIGRTSRISEERAKEISSGTGVPSDFEVLYEEDVLDCMQAEKLIHKKLYSKRINPKREFFRLPLKIAVKVVFETCLRVNKGVAKEAATRIVLVLASTPTEKHLRSMKEVLLRHKGGKLGVYLLLMRKKGLSVIIKCGDELNARLSAELINDLKKMRGIKDVIWASKDIDKFDKRFSRRTSGDAFLIQKFRRRGQTLKRDRA